MRPLKASPTRLTWIYVGQLGQNHSAYFSAPGSPKRSWREAFAKFELFGNFRPDLRGARFLARLKSREDDALLRGIADELAADGIQILESTLCLPHIVAVEGVMTRRAPRAGEWEDIRLGFHDRQGDRPAGHWPDRGREESVSWWRLKQWKEPMRRFSAAASLAKSGCVVVKVSKPQQDLRFDVPAVGVETIRTFTKRRRRCWRWKPARRFSWKKTAARLADAMVMSVVGVAHHEL